MERSYAYAMKPVQRSEDKGTNQFSTNTKGPDIKWRMSGLRVGTLPAEPLFRLLLSNFLR